MKPMLAALLLVCAGCTQTPVPTADYERCWPAWPLPDPPILIVV